MRHFDEILEKQNFPIQEKVSNSLKKIITWTLPSIANSLRSM